MLCLVTDLHCDPEGQASALAAWPKSLRQPGGKQDANSYPTQRDKQAVAGLKDRDQPGYPACSTGEGGEEVWEGQSAVPTPPHLGQWTKRPPARPEGVAEWGHTVAKRPPVIQPWPWCDLHWGRQQEGLTINSPASSPDQQPPQAKSLPLPRALGLQQRIFTDLFCSIKLQRTPRHISLQRSRPRGQRLSLALIKQGLH